MTAGVIAMHALVFVLMIPASTPMPPVLRAIDVTLVAPPPQPAPDVSVVEEAEGGGAPAALSPVRPTPDPPERPPELPLAMEQAPDLPPVPGAATTQAPTPGPGQGVTGTGTGSGSGSGSGPGVGGTRPRLIQAPTRAQIVREYPRDALRARIGGQARLGCTIRLDSRLEGCRIVDETPVGRGFGRAAIVVADAYRFSPPTQNGLPIEGQTITVVVEFSPR